MNNFSSRSFTAKWNIIFTYIQFFVNALIGIILIPVYLEFIPSELYGYWLAALGVLYWVSFFDPGLTDILSQKIGEYFGQNNIKQIGYTITNGFIIVFILVLVLLAIGLLLSFFLEQILLVENTIRLEVLTNCFILVLLGTAVMYFAHTIQSINVGLQSSISVGVFNLISIIVAYGITVVLLFRGFSLYALGATLIIKETIHLLLNTLHFLNKKKKENIILLYKLGELKSFLSNLYFNLMGKITTVITNNIRHVLIARYIGGTVVTNYSITAKIPEISGNLYEAPFKSILSQIASLKGEGKHEKILDAVYNILLLLALIIPFVFFSILLFNHSFVVLWIGESYYLGAEENFLIILNAVLYTAHSTFYYLLFSLGLIKESNIIITIGNVIFIVMSFFGIVFFDLLGLLIFWAISLLAFSWVFPLKLFRTFRFGKEQKKELLKMLITNLLLLSILNFVFSNFEYNTWGFFIIGVTFYLAVYFALIYLFNKNVRNIYSFVKKFFLKRNN